MASILISLFRALRTLLVTTHEPPSTPNSSYDITKLRDFNIGGRGGLALGGRDSLHKSPPKIEMCFLITYKGDIGTIILYFGGGGSDANSNLPAQANRLSAAALYHSSLTLWSGHSVLKKNPGSMESTDSSLVDVLSEMEIPSDSNTP